MRQQPNFYRLDRSGSGGAGGGGGGPSMMVPLPPGWTCLQDCNVSGQLNQPVVVPFVLMHPDVGVALIDVAPVHNPEAEQILRRRLEAARFDGIFPGFLPILHLRLDRADLPATEAILRDAFSAMPALSLPGGDGWVSVVRRALLPRDPARGATHTGSPGEQQVRRPFRDAAPPAQDPDAEAHAPHREAAAPLVQQSYEAESPVPAARPTGVLPWVIMAAVGGLIATLALFSLLNTGPSPEAPAVAGDAGDVPAAAAPPPAPASNARAPLPDLAASSKPPAAPPPAAGPPLPPVAAAPPPVPAPPRATAAPPAAAPPSTSAGASATPAPAQRPAPPPPPAAGVPEADSPAADRSPRVTVRQPANLRAGPDNQAVVIRVVPRGEILRVHGRTANGWVQVGDAEPRGWLHTSRLGEIEP